MTTKMRIGDILLHENTSNDLISILMRWGVGKYTHASMFTGMQFEVNGRGDYCIYESIGVGPTLTPLSLSLGKNVILIQMPLSDRERIVLAIEARRIADNPLYQYGYDDMLFRAIPAALCRKFHIPYKQNEDITKSTLICNKAVGFVYFESHLRYKLPDCIDLPPDLLFAPGATIRGGKIGEGITW